MDLFKPRVFGDTKGLKRSLRRKLGRVARSRGKGYRIYVRSGYRTYEEQAALYRNYLRNGWPLAAKPGTSRHETGRAADVQLVTPKGHYLNIGGDAKTRKLLKEEGLHRPVEGEFWHVEEL